MEVKDIALELKGLSETVVKSISDAKTEISANVDAKTASLKSELSEDINRANATAQKAQEDLDNLRKDVAMVKNLSTPQTQAKSFDVVLKEAMDEAHDDLQKFARGEKGAKHVGLELKGVDVRSLKAVADFSTGNVTGGSVWGAQYRPGIITNPNQIGHIREFLSVAPAGPGTDHYFMYENGAGEGAPANTAEKKATAATNVATGLLPSFDVDLAETSVKFETIGGVMPISRKAMLNIPNLMSYLALRVPEKLLDVEDAQLLYGDGTSPNIKGILTSGNFIAGSAAGATVLAEKIINDLSTFADTYKRNANRIVLRPADYYSFFKNKASGSGEYDLPSGFVFQNGVLYIMGIPVGVTTALTANDYALGDFQMGAEILQQESITLEFFEQDGNNVKTRQTTLRVMETIALPVYGSTFFMKGSSALS